MSDLIYLGFKPYPNSVNSFNNQEIFMTNYDYQDWLVIVGDQDLGFEGERNAVNDLTADNPYLLAPLNHHNAVNLRKLFPHTAPRRGLGERRSIGLGDRLGLATPGHIRAIKDYDVFPIFAQQSIRELKLTNRSYADVLDAVTFTVFREGYEGGFGADGDHLKTHEEIEYAIDNGYTMITLDCSEYIDNAVEGYSDEELDDHYEPYAELEEIYLAKDIDITELKKAILIYLKAIEYAEEVYNKYIENNDVDFEISIDETATATTPVQHYFVAHELTRRGIKFQTLAPRFYGEFQKGIDYIGDIERFEKEFTEHVQIADKFGYKISVHSGSDKFSVFPIIGRRSNYHYHVKTAGTNWLEAVRVIAMAEPELCREIFAHAQQSFADAKQLYHIKTELDDVQDISSIKDEYLPELLEQEAYRQLLHITYGHILTAERPDGSALFRDRLYRVWQQHSEDYEERLAQHIGRHLELLQGI